MIPSIPALGIRFDIGKIESAAYGIECWKVVWQAVDAMDIEELGGARLFEGDTAATLNGRENVYCIALQSTDNAVLSKVRAVLERSTEFQKIAASAKFVENERVVGEPLVDAGQVDWAGNLVGNAYNARAALGAMKKEKQQLMQTGQSPIPVPERKKPASVRTANLPSLSSLGELENFLLANFGDKEKYQFWLTPEELCDIVERYAETLQAQWVESSSGLSEDMTYVTLFTKGETGKNIALHGLFPFATEEAATQYCRDNRQHPQHLIGQLENLYGIQGKFATNFSGKNWSNFVRDDEYKKAWDIDPSDLWPRIYRRRQFFNVSQSSSPSKPSPSATKEQTVTQKAAVGSTSTKPLSKKKWWQFWK